MADIVETIILVLLWDSPIVLENLQAAENTIEYF